MTEQREFKPRFHATSMCRTVTLQMNQEGAMLLFDALRESTKYEGVEAEEMLRVAAQLEREMMRLGVFGIRAERSHT